ncbi:MAG: 1-acyl-sn-glycerol-3-phosphate acyltransferase [Proteobacteria bacterium]|nr:1-acyl-sn-glycerol-3-phosphate acyltransferase [Pseudomonadota bacterium]
MVRRFSLIVRLFFQWIYARVAYEPSQVQDVLSIPKDESIVYLINTENKHDFLYLNYLCLKTGMPLACISNGKSKQRFASLWHRLRTLFQRRLAPNDTQPVLAAVQNHRPILLFLNQYGRNEQQKLAHTEKILEEIRQLCASAPQLRVHLLPVGIIWERRAENYKSTLLHEIYGTPTRPSAMRRTLSVIFGPFRLFFKIGRPLCIIHHLPLEANAVASGTALRHALSDDIDRMHQQVNGPKVKPHQLLIREIVESESFLNELYPIVQETGQPKEALVLEARAILEKSSARFSLLVCKLLSTILNPLWSLIYDGLYVDLDKLNDLRELSKTHRLIFIPSHRSHVDYLVLSALLYQHGVLPPHIAAGENLNFFPIGKILRMGGAFFIKRSFRGEKLYTLCLKHYIGKVLAEGYPVEFFIEGGRSRTGQMLQPKYGILRMIAQSIVANPHMPVKIIPCAITYEKVIEDMAYKNEQEGGKKHRENVTGLIRTTKLLISKYGQIYVSFADPIDFNAALKAPGNLTGDALEAAFTHNIDVLAREIIQHINRASTITTSALLSVALLNAQSSTLSLDELLLSSAFFLKVLVDRNALISPVLKLGLAAHRASIHALPAITDAEVPADPDLPSSFFPSQIASVATMLREPVLKTIKLFEKNGCIRQVHTTEPITLEVARSGRLQMAFYKNSLFFAIIDEIYFAMALMTLPETNRTEINVRTRFIEIVDLFAIEFSLSSPQTLFDETFERFQLRLWLEENTNKADVAEEDAFDLPLTQYFGHRPEPLTVLPNAASAIAELSRCFSHHMMSYLTVFEAFQTLEGSLAESALLDRIMHQTKADTAHAPIILAESRSRVTYANAISRLIQYGYFEVSYGGSTRKPVKLLTKVRELEYSHVQLLSDFRDYLGI